MQSASRRHGSRWRRFGRKYGAFVFFSLLVVVILGVIALVMVLLNNPAIGSGF